MGIRKIAWNSSNSILGIYDVARSVYYATGYLIQPYKTGHAV